MTKKNKISLNSTLIEAVVSQTIDIQEQFLDIGGFEQERMDNISKQKSTCDIRKARALKLARKIVAMKFKNWTQSDTDFYNEWANQPVGYPGGCTRWTKTMNEYVQHVEEGEPGFCADWKHCVLPVLEVAALALAFIPVVGWAGALAISMSIGFLDGALYIAEGDEEMGGLVLFLTALPAVPSVVKKFPFVKEWGKKGAKKMAAKIVSGKIPSKLEQYQFKALTSKVNQKFLEVEVKKQLIRESVELGLRKEVIEGIEKYTAKQQAFIIKFAKFTAPLVGAAYTYFEIYDAVAKSGVLGPKDLIRKLWKKEPDDKSTVKVGKFFRKLADHDAELSEHETNWDFIKAMFKSSGSATDGELMVQAIKDGWTPYEKGKMLVAKKWRTQAYKEWINDILTNEELLKYFMSDGSDKDNELLLQWVYSNLQYDTAFLVGKNVPEEYWTETMKEFLKKREEGDTEDEYKPPPTFD